MVIIISHKNLSSLTNWVDNFMLLNFQNMCINLRVNFAKYVTKYAINQ